MFHFCVSPVAYSQLINVILKFHLQIFRWKFAKNYGNEEWRPKSHRSQNDFVRCSLGNERYENNSFMFYDPMKFENTWINVFVLRSVLIVSTFRWKLKPYCIRNSHIKTEHQRKPLREIDILHVAIDQILRRGLDELIHGSNFESQNESLWLPQCEFYEKKPPQIKKYSVCFHSKIQDQPSGIGNVESKQWHSCICIKV